MSPSVAVLLWMHDRLLKEGLMRVLPRDDFRACELVAGADSAEMAGSERFIVIVGEPPGGGLDLRFISDFRTRYPGSLIVLLVDACSTEQRWAAEKLGVAGVLLKSISSDAFVASLRLIALGENVFSAPRAFATALASPAGRSASSGTEAEADIGAPSERPGPPPVALTAMEMEILACLAAGEPNRAISRRFRLTKEAVEASLEAILTKTKAINRSQAVLWALNDMDSSELALRIRAATPLSHG